MTRFSMSLVAALLAATTACGSRTATVSTSAIPEVSERALRLYRDAIVIDAHNDMPTKMIEDGYAPDVRHAPGTAPDQGETDLPRLVESGITGQFFSAWVDAPFARRQPDASYARALEYVDSIRAFVARHPDRLTLGTTAEDVRRAKLRVARARVDLAAAQVDLLHLSGRLVGDYKKL